MNQILFEIIQNLSRFSFIRDFALFVSYVFPYIFGLLLTGWSLWDPRRIFYFSLVFLTSGVAWVFSVLVKSIFQIARPILENPIILETGHSFPSSHATVSMAAAVVVFHFDKTFGWFFIVCSIVIGLSRVVLGVHYPVDIVAGWLAGALVAVILVKLATRFI